MKNNALAIPDEQYFAPAGGRRTRILITIAALAVGVVIAWLIGQVGWLALLMIPGLVVLAGTVWNPNLGLVALIILVFAQLQSVITEFHELPGPGEPLVAFLLVVIAIRFFILNERPVGWLRTNVILGIYFIFLVVSVATAGEFEPALSEMLDVAQNLVIASMVIYLIQRPISLKMAIWGIIAAGILMASISVFQNLTGTFNNSYWGFGGWEYSGYVGRPRLTGPYETPNPYAQVLVIIFVLALDRLWHERSAPLKLVAGFAAVVSALAMVYTDSRGGFANLVFTLFIFFIFNRPNLPSLLITLVLGLGLIQFLPANYTDRLLTLTQLNIFGDSTVVADESFRGRTSENIAAWRMFLDNPIFGVGLNNYAENYQDYSREIGLDRRREARNPASLYLQLLADQGVIGTSVFLVLIASIFVSLLNAHKTCELTGRRDEAHMIAALIAALAGYMFMSIYKNNAYTNVFWVLVAICMATTQVASNFTTREDGSEASSLELKA